ncbi:hypothetical protein [Saccharopolyspora sp. NPDC002376]
MTQPQQLGPVEQEEILQEITNIILAAPPANWQRIVIEYMGVGNHIEGGAAVVLPDGSHQQWETPGSIWQLLIKLRGGMYQENLGTWLSCTYQLAQPNRYAIRYDREQEPNWLQPRPASEFADEQRFFPRDDEHMPEWFKEKLAQAKSS